LTDIDGNFVYLAISETVDIAAVYSDVLEYPHHIEI